MRTPTPLAPHKSGVHRVAAIALYRTLLAQCALAPLSPEVRDDLRNITRNRFRANRYNASEHQLKVYFEAGYEAVDHLDAAVAGNRKSTKYLKKLATEVAPEWMKKAPISPAMRLAERTKVKGESSLQAINLDLLPPVHSSQDVASLEEVEATDKPLFPGAPQGSIFARPLPKSMLRGTRRVPQLISANWIPMLRMGKPQPPALSSYITSRVKVRQNRHDRKQRLASEIEIASAEDQWDHMIHSMTPQAQSDRKQRSPTEPSWTDEITTALNHVEEVILAEKLKNIRVAGAMQRIVEREQALYEKEREEIRAARKQASAERKRKLAEVEQQLKNLKFEDVDLDQIPDIPQDLTKKLDRKHGMVNSIEQATFDILDMGLKERGMLKVVAEPGDKHLSKALHEARSSKASPPSSTSNEASRSAPD